jgi:hypothetical protein
MAALLSGLPAAACGATTAGAAGENVDGAVCIFAYDRAKKKNRSEIVCRTRNGVGKGPENQEHYRSPGFWIREGEVAPHAEKGP